MKLKRIVSLFSAVSMLFTLTVANLTQANADEIIKIACVGDSITAGASEHNYPMYLQNILGSGYEVKNFGKGGAAVKPSIDTDTDGDGVNDSRFYYDDDRYKNSLTYDADYVFVMMGTNDVRGELDTYFKADYYEYLIKPYLDNGSEVVIVTSPYAYYYMLADANVINTKIRQLQYELAEENDLTLIDMNTATANMRECFPDGLHGNSSGYMVIAQTIYKEFFDGTVRTLDVTTSPNTYITLKGENSKYGTYYRYADSSGNAKIELMPDSYTLSFRCDNFISQYNAQKIDLTSSDKTTENILTAGDYVISTGAFAYTDDDDSGNYPASNAVDEDTGSSWQTTVAGWGQPAGTHWLMIDLGMVRDDLTGVRIKGDINPRDYEIQLSTDKENWTTAYKAQGNDSKEELEHHFDTECSARYVRLYATNSLMNNFGYRYYQVATFQVLASKILTYTDSENLALKADNVTADSVHPQYSQPVESVIDGSFSTRWQAQSKGHDGDNSWLQLSFENGVNTNKAVIYWETARATEKGYAIEYSNDGENWTEVAKTYFIREDLGNSTYRDTVQFDEITAKHIRVYVTEMNGGKDLPSIWEFELYKRTATDGSVTPPPVVTPTVLKGDVNGDGVINSTDFMQVRRHYLGLFEISEEKLAAADTNEDGKINSTDFMQIRRHFLGVYNIMLSGKTIFFLGSSVTYGSAANGTSMADIIGEKVGATIIKEAVSGTTLVNNGALSYVSRLQNLAYKDKDVDIFVCQLSTNDAGVGYSLEQIGEAIEFIITYAKETWNCPVVFYTGTKYDSITYGKMVELLYDFKEKYGIGIIDLWNDAEMNAVSSENYARYMSDPIHPTLEGYKEWWTPKFIEYLTNM